MIVRLVSLSLVGTLALAGCNSGRSSTTAIGGGALSSSSSGGAASSSGGAASSSGGAASSSGGGSSSSSGGAGTVALRGLALQTRKNAQFAIGVPGAPTIYEIEENFVSQGTPVTRTSSAGIGATLDLSNASLDQVAGTLTPVNATGTATLTTNGTFANGAAVPDETGGGTSAFGRAAFLPTDPANAGDLFIIDQATDIDGDGDYDFFEVDYVDNAGVTSELKTVGIFYGGDFAPVSALAGKTRAVYSRNGGAFVRILTGNSLATAGDSSSTYGNSDVRIVADFAANSVDGRITLGGGSDPAPGDLLLSGAKIGAGSVDYTGGIVRVVAPGTTTDAAGANITESGFIGSFMGATADRTAGVFQATGTLPDIDAGSNAPERAFISGRFEADEE